MRNRSRIAALFVALIGLTLAVGVSAIGGTTQQTPARKKLLFLTHAALYKHSSLGPAEKAVVELGTLGGCR